MFLYALSFVLFSSTQIDKSIYTWYNCLDKMVIEIGIFALRVFPCYFFDGILSVALIQSRESSLKEVVLYDKY